MMDPVSPLPSICALAVALLVTFLLMRRFGSPPPQGRFIAIDGLRGYLAFFVFVHHGCLWYFYVHTGFWGTPPSNLYSHFGQSSVLFFFMITGFLFFSKVIDGRTRPIDWARLFVSRILRLTPLYLLVAMLLFLVVAVVSGFRLNDSVPKLALGIVQWTGFAVLGTPDLNGMKDTLLIVAGVPWSLRYEWLFYLFLPFLALLARPRPPLPYLLLSVLTFVGLMVFRIKLVYLMAFASGMTASVLVRYEGVCRILSSRIATSIPLFCVALAVAVFPSAQDVIPFLLLTMTFICIACGNTLFGILSSALSRTFGEMAYSIYLVHGLILFITFHFVIGVPQAQEMSSTTHWLTVIGLAPIVVCTSFLTFSLIEKPAMHSTGAVMLWLREKAKSRSGRVALEEPAS